MAPPSASPRTNYMLLYMNAPVFFTNSPPPNSEHNTMRDSQRLPQPDSDMHLLPPPSSASDVSSSSWSDSTTPKSPQQILPKLSQSIIGSAMELNGGNQEPIILGHYNKVEPSSPPLSRRSCDENESAGERLVPPPRSPSPSRCNITPINMGTEDVVRDLRVPMIGAPEPG